MLKTIVQKPSESDTMIKRTYVNENVVTRHNLFSVCSIRGKRWTWKKLSTFTYMVSSRPRILEKGRDSQDISSISVLKVKIFLKKLEKNSIIKQHEVNWRTSSVNCFFLFVFFFSKRNNLNIFQFNFPTGNAAASSGNLMGYRKERILQACLLKTIHKSKWMSLELIFTL